MSRDIISLYRARLASEKGTVIKDWGGKLTIALAYPNYYRLGMSNLGFQVVYHLLNQRTEVVAERVFLPEGQEMSLYLRTGKRLLSLESQTPLRSFDLIAFSLSFENDYPNVLNILKLGGLPPLSSERQEVCPFVMAGGIAAFLNPEPLAPFMDFFLLGEAEANLTEFIDLFLELTGGSATRKETTAALAKNISSLYVPSLYRPEYHKNGTLKGLFPIGDHVPERIKSARLTGEDFLQNQIAVSTITTPDTGLGDKTLIELGRGCGRSCRFCAAGYVYRPPRFHEKPRLRACIEKVMEKGHQLGLLSAAISDVPGIEELASIIVEGGCPFSFSSLRAESLTSGLLVRLKQAGQRTVTIAPEAGSERLRRVINKHLTANQIIEAVSMISRTGESSVKLYFLIGLPTEGSEDVTGIIDIVKAIRHNMVKESVLRGTIGRIKLSVSCFVPKPFTPFQWFPMDELESLKAKGKRLKRSITKAGGISVSTDVPRWAYVQTLLSMGDRRVGSILLMAHESGGDWTKALRFSDVNPDFFVYRPKALDEWLPWDFIDNGISKQHLIREYNLALKEEESDICRVGTCHRCGVCEV